MKTFHALGACAGAIIALAACPSGQAGNEQLFRRGDINLDGRVSLADAVYLNAFICLYGSMPACMAAADVNGNGQADLGDSISLFRFLFLGESSIQPPFPECGPITASDSLACEAASACKEPAPVAPGPFTLFLASDPDSPEPPRSGLGLFGPTGKVFEVPFFAFLKAKPDAVSGAQGWSFCLSLESGSIEAVLADFTLEGTVADSAALGGFMSGGYKHLGPATPKGAESAVVLSVVNPLTLPADRANLILRGTLRVTAPAAGQDGTVNLRFAAGLQGQGAPVSLEVVSLQQVFEPETFPLQIYVSHPDTFGYFARGDVNRDRRYDISDPIAALGYLFLGSTAPECADAADSNDDGRVDISDAVFSLGCLFLGGACPPAPFPECGPDATPDSLSCDVLGFDCL